MTITAAKKPSTNRAGTGRNTVVAIDLGFSTVRAAEVEVSAEGGRLLRKGEARLNPEFWTAPTTESIHLTQAVKEALSQAGIAERNVIVGLPRRLVTLRAVKLPNAPPDQLRSMVAFEAQQHILFTPEETLLDYYLIPDEPGAGEDMTSVMLAAARRSMVFELIAALERAGLMVSRLTVSALALGENAAGSIEATAVIDIEPGEMDLAVVADRKLLFSRAATLDNAHLDPAASEARLLDEVGRSLTAYTRENRSHPLHAVMVSGSDEAAVRSLEAQLPAMTELPVSRLSEDAAYATAVGIALQTRSTGIGQINLAPRDREERKAAAAKKRSQLFVGVLTVAALAAGFVWYQGSAQRKADLDRKTLNANNELKAVTAKATTSKQSAKRLTDFYGELSSGVARNHPLVDVLYAIDDAMPRTPDIWLTQTNLERGGAISLRGETKNEMAATDLVLALQRSGAFSDVRLGYIGEAQSADPSEAQNAAPQPTVTGTGGAASNTQRPAVNPVPGMPGVPGATTAGPPVPGATTAVPGAVATLPGATTRTNMATGARAVGSTAPRTVVTPPPAKKKIPRVSFIITCRLNEGAKSLLPHNRERKAMAATSGEKATVKRTSSPVLETDEESDDEKEGIEQWHSLRVR